MSNLKKFISYVKEENTFPLDEEREYYLTPAINIFNEDQKIATQIFDDKTAIMAVVEEQVKPYNHSVRQIHLDMLAMELAMITPEKILNHQNINGDSVIHLTTKMMCYPVSNLDMFKENGAIFTLINKYGETPLIKIADTNSLDDLKFIHGYTNGELLNHREVKFGHTALMRAFVNRKILNINFLLEQGANMYIRDNKGQNILDIFYSEVYKMNSTRKFYSDLELIIKNYK